jgi:hypothetical protein
MLFSFRICARRVNKPCKPSRSTASALSSVGSCATAHFAGLFRASAALLNGLHLPRSWEPRRSFFGLFRRETAFPAETLPKAKKSPFPLRERDRVRGKVHEVMLSTSPPTPQFPPAKGGGSTKS